MTTVAVFYPSNVTLLDMLAKPLFIIRMCVYLFIPIRPQKQNTPLIAEGPFLLQSSGRAQLPLG